ncbi:hypothetical protein DSECCO2_426860 [anaerobic digester metagenome]
MRVAATLFKVCWIENVLFSSLSKAVFPALLKPHLFVQMVAIQKHPWARLSLIMPSLLLLRMLHTSHIAMGEEAGGRAGWGLQMSAYEVETEEGAAPPSPPDGGQALVLRTVALPVSPTAKPFGFLELLSRTFGAHAPVLANCRVLRTVVPPMAICDWQMGRSTSTKGAQATTVHGMGTCPKIRPFPGTNRGCINLIRVEMRSREWISTEPFFSTIDLHLEITIS